MKITRKFKWALPLALLMALLVVVGALALTITVDGAISDWTPAGGGANDARIATDVNEDGSGGTPQIPDEVDISQVFLTNSQDMLYVRFDTYQSTVFGSGFVLVCINNDNNANTGGDISQCDGGTGVSMEGVDYVIRSTMGLLHQLLECEDTDTSLNACSIVSGVTPQFANSGVYTEIGVYLADIGFGDPATCPDSDSEPCEMRINVYLDNGDTPEDDNVPDSGSLLVQVGSDSPTAITLTQLEAQSNTPAWIAAAGLGLLALAGGAALIFKRRQA